MDTRTFIKDDSGVENAVYGILMIAIVVMVALLIASLVLSQGGEVQVLASSPTASMTGVLTGGASPTLLINHESGDPLQVGQMILNTYDDNGTLVSTTNILVYCVTPSQLSPGMQTSAITLTMNPGTSIYKGSRYTVKVVSTQTKQQIGSITGCSAMIDRPHGFCRRPGHRRHLLYGPVRRDRTAGRAGDLLGRAEHGDAPGPGSGGPARLLRGVRA